VFNKIKPILYVLQLRFLQYLTHFLVYALIIKHIIERIHNVFYFHILQDYQIILSFFFFISIDVVLQPCTLWHRVNNVICGKELKS